ncbi:MAG: cobalt ECF transporter T component CbiQ [Thermodesulfobacteriota bacterium]|nr:cobalt ECF transporter T component CbiQ [Thermodesulfobacteriota bacterium]
MISEPFAAGTSFFHRMEPRIRIVCALVYSIAVAVCVSFPPVVLALLFSVLMTGAARLNPGLLFRRIAVVNIFILFFWLVLPFTYDGDPLFRVAGLAVTRQGVAFAALLTLKSNAIILGLVALVATMSFVTMGHALGRLGLPDKLVNLLLMTYRYIFVIEAEYGRIVRAVKIRGFVPRTSLHAYKTYAYIVGMLFVKASERAERVYGAMQCRGFKGKFYTLSRLPFSRGSWVFAGVMGGMIVCIACLEICGNG